MHLQDTRNSVRVWLLMPLTSALRELKQKDCHALQASLGYIVSFRLTWSQSETWTQNGGQ